MLYLVATWLEQQDYFTSMSVQQEQIIHPVVRPAWACAAAVALARFLSPSHLAERVVRPLRPLAFPAALCGLKRFGDAS